MNSLDEAHQLSWCRAVHLEEKPTPACCVIPIWPQLFCFSRQWEAVETEIWLLARWPLRNLKLGWARSTYSILPWSGLRSQEAQDKKKPARFEIKEEHGEQGSEITLYRLTTEETVVRRCNQQEQDTYMLKMTWNDDFFDYYMFSICLEGNHKKFWINPCAWRPPLPQNSTSRARSIVQLY